MMARRIEPPSSKRSGWRGLTGDLTWVAGAVVLLQFVFLALLVVGAAVPDRTIVDDLSADVHSGAYGPSGTPDGMGGRSTSFTDCVAAGTGLGRPEFSMFERAVRMPRLESCAEGSKQIQQLARGGDPEAGLPYFRYWAGYTVLTRPVLAVGGMDAMRLVSGGLFGFSLIAMVLAVSRVTSAAFALAITAPLLLSSNVLSVPSSGFSHALSLAAIFGGVALTALATQRSRRLVLCAVAAAACFFNFVDLLTTPAIAWAMTASVVGAATFVRRVSLPETVGMVLLAGAVWPAAFAVTWVSRWLFAAAFLGWDYVMGVVLGIARFRIDGDYGTVSETFGAAIGRNLETWFALPIMPELVLLLAAVGLVGSLVIAWRRFGWTRVLAASVIAAPALVVPVWMLILSNHSQIHHVFVYRGWTAAVGVVLGAGVVAAQRHRSDSAG